MYRQDIELSLSVGTFEKYFLGGRGRARIIELTTTKLDSHDNFARDTNWPNQKK